MFEQRDSYYLKFEKCETGIRLLLNELQQLIVRMNDNWKSDVRRGIYVFLFFFKFIKFFFSLIYIFTFIIIIRY